MISILPLLGTIGHVMEILPRFGWSETAEPLDSFFISVSHPGPDVKCITR
jgi:hypothetical protein